VIIALGKFQGVIIAATPIGSLIKTSCLLLEAALKVCKIKKMTKNTNLVI
jgi:hypothetical protein